LIGGRNRPDAQGTSAEEDRVTQSDRTSFDAFAARIRALGFDPPPANLEEMFAAMPHLEAMRARLRRPYTYADEPAHVFRPEGGDR
jgi:hypothetical protein